MQRPTKRARFMRGVVAPIFGLLAALSIVLGVLNATVWKPSSIVSAHANVYGSRYIVTDPGVLNLVDYRVKISVAALNSRKPICVAVGLAKDVRGWTKGYSVQRITGLNNWNSLSTDVMRADDGARIDSTKTDDSKVSKDASKDVDFKDSDLWTNATCQMGLAKLSINAADFEQAGNAADLALKQESQEQNNAQSNSKNGAQSQTSRQKLSSELQSKIARRVLIIDLGKNSPEAFVELRWRRHNLPDFATPMYFVGALFILLCGLSASVFAMAPHRRRNKRLVASRTGLISVENNSQEEVKFSEALAGTIAGIFGSHKDKKSKHKVGSGAHARHGVHARTRTAKSKSAVDSSISVKSGLNSSKTAALDETTVISKDDLQAYFARLASESSSDFKGDFAAGNKESETFDLSSANQSEQSEDLREAAESSESSESSEFRNSRIAGKSGKSQKSQKSQKSESASKSESGFAKKRYKKESYKDRNDRNNRKENSAGGSKKANRGERKNRDGRMDAEYYKDDDGRKSDNRIGENLGKSSEAFDSTSAKPGDAKPGEARRKSRNQFNQRDYRSQNRGKNRKYKGSENRTSGSASGGNVNGNKASNNANHDANGSSKPSKNRKK